MHKQAGSTQHSTPRQTMRAFTTWQHGTQAAARVRTQQAKAALCSLAAVVVKRQQQLRPGGRAKDRAAVGRKDRCACCHARVANSRQQKLRQLNGSSTACRSLQPTFSYSLRTAKAALPCLSSSCKRTGQGRGRHGGPQPGRKVGSRPTGRDCLCYAQREAPSGMCMHRHHLAQHS